MNKKLLLSAPMRAPGPMTALRNHQAVLRSHINCNLVPLEELISPAYVKVSEHKRFLYRISKKIKAVFSIKKILPYGENVIFGGFNIVHEGIIKKLHRLGIRPSFIWCSTLGQMELTPLERENFLRLVELLKKGYIRYLFLSRRLYDSLSYFVKEATCLPYSIDLASYKTSKEIELPGINMDLFCRPRQGKNILNQIAAFAMADIDSRLHINFKTDFLSGIPDILSAKIIYHKWLPSQLYYNFIAGMNISLQITIGESFNYVACERMCLGVPVLTTKDIYFIAADNFLAKYLCVEVPDTPAIIANMITYLIKNKELRNELAERCKSRIAAVAQQNNKEVIDLILRYFLS